MGTRPGVGAVVKVGVAVTETVVGEGVALQGSLLSLYSRRVRLTEVVGLEGSTVNAAIRVAAESDSLVTPEELEKIATPITINTNMTADQKIGKIVVLTGSPAPRRFDTFVRDLDSSLALCCR